MVKMSKLMIRFCVGFLVLILLLMVSPARMIDAQNDDQTQNAQDCCFANPQYAGICQVNPAEGETCATILDYLNNPNSAGKTYCDSTRIRGGWKQIACQTEDNQTQTQD
jgi:hypothetical protein